jgi:hypothetical protein
LVKDSIQTLVLRSRYIIGNQAIVFPKPVIKGVNLMWLKNLNYSKEMKMGIALKVTANGDTKIVKVTWR